MEVTAAERTTTYTGAQSLAAKINGYIVAQHTSIAAIAKEIGYSRVTISRYLSGKYDSDPTGIEEKLAAFLAGQTGEMVALPPPPEPGQKGGQKPRFYESRDAKAVLGVCQSCQEYIGLGIVLAIKTAKRRCALLRSKKMAKPSRWSSPCATDTGRPRPRATRMPVSRTSMTRKA